MTRAELTDNERLLVDEVLENCAKLEATLGKDSTGFEREEVRLKKQREYEKIKIIKPELYKTITQNER